MSLSSSARGLRKVILTEEDIDKAYTAYIHEDSDDEIGYLTLPNVDIVPRFSTLESHITQVILEDAINELLILSSRRPKASHDLKYPTLQEKFGLEDVREQLFDEETNKLIEETRDERRLTKMQKDRDLLVKVLTMSVEEAKETLTLVGLGQVVAQESKVIDEEEQLRSQYRNAIEEQKRITQASIELAEELQILQQQKRIEIDMMQKTVEETVLFSGVKLAYTKRWTNARRYQNSLTWSLQERKLHSKLRRCLKTVERDNLVNENLIIYMKQAIKDYAKETQHWTERYDDEIEEMDIEITALRNKLEDMDKAIVKLKQTFAERQEMIDEYMVIRNERQRIEDERLMREAAATRIQAWWRGTMVRRHLGPYKLSKKKKKGKKGDKGKKKKK